MTDVPKAKRVIGRKYLDFKNRIGTWDGRELRCEHGRQRYECKDCGGNGICTHGKKKSVCKLCGGSQICVHGRQRYECKDCQGNGICPHGRKKRTCRDCGGSGICQHDKVKTTCKECAIRYRSPVRPRKASSAASKITSPKNMPDAELDSSAVEGLFLLQSLRDGGQGSAASSPQKETEKAGSAGLDVKKEK
eukprot:GSChrysophyteH1.ASY1.ANO1.212.1 assembled CDS